uniref:Uncharacterized protein n=1 Tax=Arundo donax TaxID=35708 RepID=A0A0A8ZXL2_ARUDO
MLSSLRPPECLPWLTRCRKAMNLSATS